MNGLTKPVKCSKLAHMLPRRILLIILLILFSIPSVSHAFWVWTPETNKWINPKYSVKDTPSEQLEFAIGFYKNKEYEEALREFRKLIRHYPRAREAPDAQYYIGKVFEDQGEVFTAFKEYQIVVEKYPFSDRSVEIVKLQYEIGNKLLEGEGTRNKFMSTLKGTNYNVIDIFQTIIKNAPYGDLAAPSQYKIGLYLMEQGLYQESRDEFEKVVNDYPQSEWAKAAQFQIAQADAKRSAGAQYDQKTTQAAVEEFKEFLEANPDAELSDKAKEQIRVLREKEAENNFMIAQYYEKTKNYPAAKIYYQSIVDNYRDSTWAQKALSKVQEVSKKIK